MCTSARVFMLTRGHNARPHTLIQVLIFCSVLAACASFWHRGHPHLVSRGGKSLFCFLEPLVVGREIGASREGWGLAGSGALCGGGWTFQNTHFDAFLDGLLRTCSGCHGPDLEGRLR